MVTRLLNVLDAEMSLRPRLREEGDRRDRCDDQGQRGSTHFREVIMANRWDMERKGKSCLRRRGMMRA